MLEFESLKERQQNAQNMILDIYFLNNEFNRFRSIEV